MKFSEYLDRKYIADLVKRFKQINAERFRRAHLASSDRGQTFLEVLPLILHSNHPMLPGYISQETPCGISDYSPTATSIRAAKTLAKSFSLQRKTLLTRDILSIFLMGSSGSIAHSGSSDFDIWVIHRQSIAKDDLELLEEKLEKISKWATTINMDVHFFLMEPDHFKSDINVNAEGEHCGTAQHFLLLDEFYRTAILVAGLSPLWWAVPVELNDDYDEFVKILVERKFLDGTEFIDFGGIKELPANEYLGAGLWHLYKALDNPYKSVLKLMLMESYVSDYPKTTPLSSSFKQLVYRGMKEINQLDPYMMVYRRIERYFVDNQQWQRLEFLRECFYLKIGERVTALGNKKLLNWRQELLLELTEQWSWHPKKLKRLDSRSKWKIEQVSSERKRLISELNESYRFLSEFAKQDQIMSKISQDDLTRLGRKLYATFERKSGKIERVNTGIAPNITELELTLIENPKNSAKPRSWSMYAGALSKEHIHYHTPLKRSYHLTEIILWGQVNGVISSKSSFQIFCEKGTALSYAELNSMRRSINEWFSEPAIDAIVNFNAPAKNQIFGIFVNVGADPIAQHAGTGNQLVTDQIDALTYGEAGTSLVLSLDILFVNSWKETMVYHFVDEHCVSDAIAELLKLLPHEQTDLKQLEVFCLGASRSEQIQKRLSNLVRQCIQVRYEAEYAMYSTQIRGDMVSMVFESGQYYPIIHSSEDRWAEFLSSSKEHGCRLYIDNEIQLTRPLHVMTEVHRLGQVSLFYFIRQNKADVYILDEQGVYYHRQQSLFNLVSLLQPYGRFIMAVHKRIGQQNWGEVKTTPEILCYELIKDEGRFQVQQGQISLSSVQKHYFNIEVISEELNQPGDFLFYCDHKEFSTLEYGKDLLKAVAEYVLKQRRSSEPYPVYITDLDLSSIYGEQPLSTSVYLRHKSLLEKKINQEIQQLSQPKS